jgi:hypothetical protein
LTGFHRRDAGSRGGAVAAAAAAAVAAAVLYKERSRLQRAGGCGAGREDDEKERWADGDAVVRNLPSACL